jgi:actin cytoskeleton-regulatory complex protein SLA1
MSHEDLEYVRKLTGRRPSRHHTNGSEQPQTQKPPSKPKPADSDDEPLGTRRHSLQVASSSPSPVASSPTISTPPPKKKGPGIDWFEFFLSAGCDIDDCTRYASSFERDKIDEAILPDITEATMRSLGLREGDIIRVAKAITLRQPVKKNPDKSATVQAQISKDEEYAWKLQQQENDRRKQTTSPPNLFAGPDGTLKQPRRGRPQPSKSLPTNVDINSISTPSEPVKRTESPSLLGTDASTPASATAPSPVNLPPRSTSTSISGFDDDAWTNRPSSTKPTPPTSTAPGAALAPAPAAAQANPPPAPTPPPAPASAPPAPVAPTPPADSGAKNLAKTTEADVFEQLARLGELRTRNPAATSSPAPQAAPSPVLSPPPRSFSRGMGMGSSPVPIGQHLQAQPTGFTPQAAPGMLPQPTGFTSQATPGILPQQTGFTPQPNPSLLPQQTGFTPSTIGPRGPFAPVPANQSLLQPLVPTTTGFNGFVPTRPMSTPAAPGFQPSFLSSQPTGFAGQPQQQPLMSQPTGFSTSSALLPQTTGFPAGVTSPFGSGSIYNPNGFGNTQTGELFLNISALRSV